MATTHTRPPEVVTVTVRSRPTRTVKRSVGGERKVYAYRVPELVICGRFLSEAGFTTGERLAVTIPKPGFIVISRLKPIDS